MLEKRETVTPYSCHLCHLFRNLFEGQCYRNRESSRIHRFNGYDGQACFSRVGGRDWAAGLSSVLSQAHEQGMGLEVETPVSTHTGCLWCRPQFHRLSIATVRLCGCHQLQVPFVWWLCLVTTMPTTWGRCSVSTYFVSPLTMTMPVSLSKVPKCIFRASEGPELPPLSSKTNSWSSKRPQKV